jgi:hypothetical protein
VFLFCFSYLNHHQLIICCDPPIFMASTDDLASPYWSETVPNIKQLKDIIQIHYYLRPHRDGPDAQLVDIWALNLFGKITNKNPYYWATFPNTYAIHFKRLFFRLELLKYVASLPKGPTLDPTEAKRYLAHIDRTIDAMFDEAQDAMEAQEMNKDWRSSIFDRYLLVEFHAQRHTPYDVENVLEQVSDLWDMEVDTLGLPIIFYI